MPDRLDLAIIVPSRHRPHNMPAIRRLLPSATVCVDEREVDDYALVVPRDRLLAHPPMDGFAVVCNWIMDAVAAEILCFVVDDLIRVLVLTGWRRSGRGAVITEADTILGIIENAARAALDIGASTFAFSRTANATMLRPAERPLRPVAILSNVFGIMGSARHRKMDPRFAGRNAIELSLRTLLEDRFGYADCRFYFDCGPIFAGRGGNVGLVTAARWAESTRALKETYGKHVGLKRVAIDGRGKIDTMRIRVSRANARAQR